MWMIVICIIVVAVIITIISLFIHLYKDKGKGIKFLKDCESRSGIEVPDVYYHKQRMYRYCYGFFIGVHYLLIVMSVTFSSITIWMVTDENKSIALVVSVIAAISTTLQTVLRFDKIAEGYICAVRIMEQAILEFKHGKFPEYRELLEANKRAEEVIHNLYH